MLNICNYIDLEVKDKGVVGRLDKRDIPKLKE